MTVIEFLNELSQQGVQLWVEDNKLRYRAQKGVLTQGQRHRLAQHKGEILNLLQKPRLLPLSFAQQRLWLLEQLEPESPAYNIPVAIRLQGVVDSAALGQSINEIIRRHEILRTTFSAVDGQPFQCVSSSLTLTVRRVDLVELPQNKRETQALRLAAEEARKPFDLSHGPLVGATLLRLGVKEHILLLIIHHIVFDGWSMELLYRELVALYRAFSSGQPSPLPELPLQYADFTIWQRQWLQGELRETQLAYWKAQLEDLPTLELPYDHPQPVLQSFQGAKHPLALPKDLSEALKALSKRAGITPFMLLLAVFKVLLYRYTGQDDIIVGTPIANRQRLETEGLIGFFVNMLVMRTTLSGHITFQELLSRIRQTALGAYAHQDLPFEKLVEELSPQRDSGGNPLFQVTFALRSAPRQVTGHSEWSFDQEVEKPDLEFQLWGDPEGLSGAFLYNVEFDLKTARFNLELQLWDDPEGFGGVLTYNSALFEAATIARMEGHFQTLLQGVVANPEARLADLPLLTASERHQMLVEWNNTRSDYPKDQCVHQLFEAQVERTPAAIAVTFGEQQLTYRQLNNRANQLAHYLQKHGVGPEVLVGICLERSLEMVIGLLGVLKAGGAYVPLDPTYPKERLAFMLNDTQAPVLLTQQRLLAGIPEPKAEVICLDVDWQIVSQESEHNPVYEVTSENLVYVIYTSGSTGQPKGVALPHRSLLNLVTWQLDHSTLPPGTKTLQFASLSFDVSAQEILVT
ncbi:MAG: condensation domain-containing protein, partial [Anaerolineae bacterium]|nr:condensation domain-containing protein [Anaerolineae bacterium]